MTIPGALNTLKDALGLGAANEPDPSWEDRLLEAAYTGPSGRRLTFDYEDVSKSIDKKTTGFNFPDVNGTYVQDNGLTGRRYPMRIFIWGKDYDIVTKAFESLLEETGPGKLEHPMYGTVNVVPFGTIRRRDDLKSKRNQSILEVVFWDTTGVAYPSSQADPESEANAAIEAFNAAADAQLEQQLALTTPFEEASFLDRSKALLQTTKNVLSAIAEVQQEVLDEFNESAGLVESALDIGGDVLGIAQNTRNMIQAPGRAAALMGDRLDAYGNLAARIFGQAPAKPTTGPNAAGTDNTGPNAFFTDDLYASTFVTGSAVSALNNVFDTRASALGVAEELEDQLENVVVWREDNYQSLGSAEIPSPAGADMGQAYEKLRQAVSLTMGYLLDTSLRLKQERSVVLEKPRSIVDLCGELYGGVEAHLDFFVTSNDFTGDEILEIPRGREVKYYV